MFQGNLKIMYSFLIVRAGIITKNDIKQINNIIVIHFPVLNTGDLGFDLDRVSR